MERKVQTGDRVAGCVLALLTLAAGIVIFIILPVIGWVIGPILCLLALFMGGKEQRIWRCRDCHAVIPRG